MAAAFVLYPAFIQWRLENESVTRYATLVESDNVRIDGLLAGVQLFLSAPLLGIGFGHYIQLSTDVPGVLDPINAHNWYLAVLAEQGLVGVALWIALALAGGHQAQDAVQTRANCGLHDARDARRGVPVPRSADVLPNVRAAMSGPGRRVGG